MTNFNILNDYNRISRISIDSFIKDMFEEIENIVKEKDAEATNLNDQITCLEDENSELRDDIARLTGLIDNLHNENIRLISENICLLTPNKPKEFFQK
jgi:predicted nuclease with TOPRIM domain